MSAAKEIQERRIDEFEPDFTIRQVSLLADFLPERARAELAEGPMSEERCQVCFVLSQFRGSGAAWALHFWHSADGYGETAKGEEQWQRCEAIYRVCGWPG